MVFWSALLAGGLLGSYFATPVAIRLYHVWLWRGRSADDVIMKIYDVRDLTFSVQSFCTPASPPADPPGYTAEELMQEIREAVGRYNWPEDKTRLEERSGKLIVIQIPEGHARTSRFLEEVRRRQCRQVHLETRFLTGGRCARLLRELGGSPGAALTPEQVRRLRKVISDSGGKEILCPRLTAFNGQTASVFALKERTFNTDYDEDGSPSVKTIPLGCRLRACSNVSADLKRVDLDVTAGYCKLLNVRKTSTKHGTAEVPVLDDRAARASVALPSGGWTALLLKGEADAGEVIVLVRALVIDFVEEEQKL
jgi:hypothetical protein